MVNTVVITPPDPVVTLAEAKVHLRVDTTDDDDLIAALCDAAMESLDGPRGWLGRAVGLQTLELRRDGFANQGDHHHHRSRHGFTHHEFRGRIDLPYPPITAIVSIKYDDGNGDQQTLDPSKYVLKDGAACLAYGANWPAHRPGPESVVIQYTAGYEIVPAPIKAAILLRIGDLYVNREARVIDAARVAMVENATVDILLSPYRIWSVV